MPDWKFQRNFHKQRSAASFNIPEVLNYTAVLEMGNKI